MYALAHLPLTEKNITVTSIADFRNEISVKTSTGNGAVTDLGSSFKNMNTPAPFNFTWQADKTIPEAFFTTLRYGDTFSFELRIQEFENKKTRRSTSKFNFYNCTFFKARILGGRKVKVEASYGSFDKEPE